MAALFSSPPKPPGPSQAQQDLEATQQKLMQEQLQQANQQAQDAAAQKAQQQQIASAGYYGYQSLLGGNYRGYTNANSSSLGGKSMLGGGG